MANYEYECPRCHRNVDIIKPMSELDRVENCDACGHDMRRRFSIPATAFVRGGTGAGRGSRPARAQSQSDTIRSMNPQDKAAVQRENVYRESGLEISDAGAKKMEEELARG